MRLLILTLAVGACAGSSHAPSHALRPASAELVEKDQRARQTLADVDAALERAHRVAPRSSADDHDTRVAREGSENRLLRARQVHAEAVAEYNAALSRAGDAVLDPVSGRRLEPRASVSAANESSAEPNTTSPLRARVTDLAGRLPEGERAGIERELEAYDRATTNEIVVLLVASLDGRRIEDVAFETFNASKIGKKGLDNGVLLVIAIAERKVRIETGRGVGGLLPDLRANDIIQTMKPSLRNEAYVDAVQMGIDGIKKALAGL